MANPWRYKADAWETDPLQRDAGVFEQYALHADRHRPLRRCIPAIRRATRCISSAAGASNCDAATNLCAPAIVSSGKSNHGWLDDGTEIVDGSASNVDEEANAGPVADASDQMSFVSRSFSTGGTGGRIRRYRRLGAGHGAVQPHDRCRQSP